MPFLLSSNPDCGTFQKITFFEKPKIHSGITLYFTDENEAIVASKRFVIMDPDGQIVFSTSPTETLMSSKKMKVSGKTPNSKKILL